MQKWNGRKKKSKYASKFTIIVIPITLASSNDLNMFNINAAKECNYL